MSRSGNERGREPGAADDLPTGGADPRQSLYDLLPEFLRYEDALQGEPLRALLEVLEGPRVQIQESLERLYDNWFIETCEPWVVPYIGRLVGLGDQLESVHRHFDQRARVANAIAHRRRKGTPAALAGALADATGWVARVVQGIDHIGITQSLVDPRVRPGEAGRGGLVNLRHQEPLRDLDGPFSTVPRLADLTRPGDPVDGASPIPATAGAFDPRTLVVQIWRLESYPVTMGTARRVRADGYTVHPLGVDTELFHRPKPAVSGRVGPRNVPEPLATAPWLGAVADLVEPAELAGTGDGDRHDARAADGALEAWLGHPYLAVEGARSVDRRLLGFDLFGADPSFRVLVKERTGAPEPVPPEEILVADLEDWTWPRAHRAAAASGRYRLALDPRRGRLLFPSEDPFREVRVSWCYGFSADIGGGPYDRRPIFLAPGDPVWQAVVSRDVPRRPAGWSASAGLGLDEAGVLESPLVDSPLFSNLDEAMAAWAESGLDRAHVRILDSASYAGPGDRALHLDLRGGRELVLETAPGQVPALLRDILVDGDREAEEGGGRLVLHGLWIGGRLAVRGGPRVEVSHCTVWPGPGDGDTPRPAILAVEEGCDRLLVELDSSIVGAIRLPSSMLGLWVGDSIIDGESRAALAGPRGPARAPGPATSLRRTTVFGAVRVDSIDLGQAVVFADPVVVERPWRGRVIDSFAPEGSSLPDAGSGNLVAPVPSGLFTSRRYGDPGYAQLGPRAPEPVVAGGGDGSEMGAFHLLYQPQRRSTLPHVLSEYVPWGLEARVLYVT